MSRIKRFAHSLVSSYALMGVNAVYSLVTIPLALKYLSRAEFGLWAVTLQVATYISLIDLGMSSSVARILIDHKDDRTNGRYGGAIKNSFLVGAVQALVVLLVGLSLAWFVGGWLRVPAELDTQFFWLMIGQVLLTAGTFLTRIFTNILIAWQRIDVSNYAQIVQLAAGFGGLWLGLTFDFGVFSFLAGAAVSWVAGVLICGVACHRLGFLPTAREWGQLSLEQFKELFSYGTDVFLISVGVQLVASSQTVLVSRQLGMEAATLWSVMTKPFSMVAQLFWRMIGTAMPMFSEMYVRKENERMWSRYRTLFTTVSVSSGVAVVLFAAGNSLFVDLWMSGRFSWPRINDCLLGLWLLVLTQQCCHNSLIISLKQVKALKYVFLVEGIVFVAATLVVLPRAGITGMLICSLVASFLFTWATSIWRVGRLAQGGLKALLWDWQLPLFPVLAATIPCWIITEWLRGYLSPPVRLVVGASLIAGAGLFAAVRFSLPRELTTELVGKLPRPAQRPASFLLRCVYGRTYGRA